MHVPQVNYLAVLVAGVLVFILGGLWYSPALFARRWVALQGKTEEELRASAGPSAWLFIVAFICGLLQAYVLAILLNHFRPLNVWKGLEIGIACWVGFAGATSLATANFSCKPKALWAIDSGFNLVAFAIAGAVIGWWPWA